MRFVRLFVQKDSQRYFLDIPYGEHTEAQAALEMEGANIYYASLLPPEPKRSRKLSKAARLRQRMY
jgi:hypothetical protein